MNEQTKTQIKEQTIKRKHEQINDQTMKRLKEHQMNKQMYQQIKEKKKTN